MEHWINTEGKWRANESLLQSYRLMFISLHSFMLVVGAIAYGKDFVVLPIVSGISVYLIWGVWVPVVFARHKIVDYYKYASRLPETQLAALCTVTQYVKNDELRKRTNELFRIEKNLRRTRIKIDIIIPLSLTLLWIVFNVSACYGY